MNYELAQASAHDVSVIAKEAPESMFARCRNHVLGRIEQASTAEQPFHHAFIEDIFPTDFYRSMRAHMIACKNSDKVHERHQDNANFVNQRYNLLESDDDVARCIRQVFSDSTVKRAIVSKFYASRHDDLAEALSIHEEFEYVFTAAGRFQNIHVDIPPKFVSFVFYIPEQQVSGTDAERNATILYDKALQPQYAAKFEENSVCIFAPHFFSYHGFSSTIDRDVLVMFYVNNDELEQWREVRKGSEERAPFTDLLDAIERKLRTYPMRAMRGGEQRILAERAACLVNAPRGRVMIGSDGKPRSADDSMTARAST